MVYARWKAYLAAATLLIGGFFFVPSGGWLETFWQVAVGWAAAAAVVVGVRSHRPSAPVAWYCFAVGIWLNSTGIAVEAILTGIYGPLDPPSIADGFYLALYPALAVGLTLLIRRRTPGLDPASLLDAATISTGLGLVAWVFLVQPAVGAPSLSTPGQMVVVAYPVGDVAVLVMIMTLFFAGGRRGRSLTALGGAVAAFLVGDIGWAIINQLGLAPGARANHLMEMIFLVGYTLVGVAALHPSVRGLSELGSPRPSRLRPRLLAVLTVASLLAPGVLVVEVVTHDIIDGLAIAIGSAILFLCVIARMTLLLRQVETQSIYLGKLTRTDELTGLANRRGWLVALPSAMQKAGRNGTPLSVAMVDLDYFKEFNDTYGHQAGDLLLRSASIAWQSQVRSFDQIARYAGDEFIVLLPDADTNAARTILERLRPVTPLGQTFSAGVVSWDGQETTDEIIARADHALYQAKAKGRDQINSEAHATSVPRAGVVTS